MRASPFLTWMGLNFVYGTRRSIELVEVKYEDLLNIDSSVTSLVTTTLSTGLYFFLSMFYIDIDFI